MTTVTTRAGKGSALTFTELDANFTNLNTDKVDKVGAQTMAGALTAPGFIPNSSTVPTNGVFLPAANTLGFSANGSEAARIDSSGRLLVGPTTARGNIFNSTGNESKVQIEGTDYKTSAIQIICNSNSADGSIINLGKTRGTSIGSNTAVQSGDSIGAISFQGSGGTNLAEGAAIVAVVDGTPGNSDMPGLLSFRTTADGSAAPTERLRIDSSGNLLHGTTSAPSKITTPCFAAPNYSGYFISRVVTSGSTYNGNSRTITLTFPDVGYSDDFPAMGQIEASMQLNVGVSTAAGSPNISYVKRVRDFVTTDSDGWTSDSTPQQVWLNSTLDMVKGSGIDITFAVSGRVLTITFTNSHGLGQAQYGQAIIRSNVQPTIATA